MNHLKGDKTGAGWRWALILGIVAVLAAGYFIGYLWSALLIAAMVSFYKKRHPGMPAGGYCLAQTRKRLSQLVWALLLLAVGAALGVFHWSLSRAGQPTAGSKEYVQYIISLIGAIGFIGAGLVTGFFALRDTFFPARSTLAKSIRAQLPDSGNDLGVSELFAMVDEDIKENGQWFDRIAVGKKWLLGERAGYIPGMRVIFGRDEVSYHHRNGSVQSTRIVELYVMDSQRRVWRFAMRNPAELPQLMNCITLRAPGILAKPFSEYPAFRKISDGEWEKILKEYDLKKSQESQGQKTGLNENQSIILSYSDGSVTSRVTPQLVKDVLKECLMQGEDEFTLTAGRPVQAMGKAWSSLVCYAGFYEDIDEPQDWELAEWGEVDFLLRPASGSDGQPGEALSYQTNVKEAEDILMGWLEGRVPDVQKWESLRLRAGNGQEQKRELLPPHLSLLTPLGAFQRHETFTLEDVQVAADGLTDGSYQEVELVLPGGYLMMKVEVLDRTRNQCLVCTTRADGDKLRFFRRQAASRQAAFWFMEFANGVFHIEGNEWKEYTRQAGKKSANHRRKK